MASVEIYYLSLTIFLAYGYDNVALNKPTWQSNQYNVGDSRFDSSNAVDGQKSDLRAWGGQCVVSADFQRTATWWVNLQSIYSIHSIRIYYRTDNAAWDSSNGYTAKFLRFSVYVSNTTGRLNGHLCFRDTNYDNSTIPAVANIPCPVHGQFVIYYNERLSNVTYPDGYSRYAHNEVCEVEVYGCRSGYYGPNCSLPCPDKCRYCHIETGLCSWCRPGYQGYQCKSECDGGRYGQDCGESCGACLEYKECHHINGSCLEGCDAGYKGNLCKSECSVGKFGNNCEQDCNNNCGVPNRCNRTTGECVGGCQIGLEGLQCRNTCLVGWHRHNCSQMCSNCDTCDRFTGQCTSPCKPEWNGLFCTDACPNGWYGQNCSQMCSNCDQCDRFTGQCTSPCKPGWKGLYCRDVQTQENSKWQPNFYGILGAFFVSATANLVLIVYICLKRKRKKKLAKPPMEEMFKDAQRKPNAIYENSDEKVTGEYQELGELAISSHYDALQ